ncbi:AraC family transcriptional regulator [Streptomyces sp. SID13031]|nr:AraC family transcriptional regulator [Streptomyces sp. SID13031]
MQIVAVLAIEGAVALEVAGACQVFAAAHDPIGGEPLYDVRVCGDRAGTTMRAHRVEIFRAQAPYSFDDALEADTLIVPASYAPSAEVLATVREAHLRGTRIASICTGAFTLAAAGLLDGRVAATHWAHAERLAREYPQVEVATDVLYLDDGDLLTSAGVTAGLDLCLHLVRRDHGSAVAGNVARRLVMAPHRDGGQAQFITAPTVAGDHPNGVPENLLPDQPPRMTLLAEYDEAWAAQYAPVAEDLRKAFGETVTELEHIGSTASTTILPAHPVAVPTPRSRTASSPTTCTSSPPRSGTPSTSASSATTSAEPRTPSAGTPN